MVFEKIDREACKFIRAELNSVIAEKLSGFGLEGAFLSASFDDERVTFKVEIKKSGVLGERDKRVSESLTRHVKWMAEDLGVDSNKILNMVYRNGSDTFKLVGHNSRAKRFNLIMENLKNGKRYKFTEDIVRKTFSRKVA